MTTPFYRFLIWKKTLIDFFYFKQPLAKETLSEIKRKIDKAKLDSYLKFYPKRF
jgi:hypothetical protein